MEVRFTFRGEVYVSGDTMEEIKEKWESFPLFSDVALEEYDADFVELETVEDAETYKDLMNDFVQTY
jgi:hypothetical protein